MNLIPVKDRDFLKAISGQPREYRVRESMATQKLEALFD